MTAPLFHKVVKKPSDLVTKHSATVKGFINQANAKISTASKFVKEAYGIREDLANYKTKEEILNNQRLRRVVLFAAGLSQKAQGHLTEQNLDEIANTTIETLQADSDDIKSEILFRYLLTAGDSLGGSMRNLTGSLAQKIIVRYILNLLQEKEVEFKTTRTQKGKIQIIFWQNRVMVFDRTPKFIGKNIDVILLSGSIHDLTERNLIELKDNYISAGEIKGGIDPAGADEHWKTASKALERIRSAFSDIKCPKLFFLGAAIEESMAEEIYSDVISGNLEFAANINSEEQTSVLINWLISL